jgi:hypothetical protein
MGQNLKLILIALFAAIIIAVCVLVVYYVRKTKLCTELQNSVSTLVNKTKEDYSQVTLLKSDIENLKDSIETIIKEAGIKKKEIVTVIEYSTAIDYDTIYLKLKDSIRLDSRCLSYTVRGTCFSTDAIVDFTKTSIQVSDSDACKLNVYLENTEIMQKGVILNYSKRDTTKFLKFWPFAKKKFYQKTVDNCNGAVTIEEINFK